MTSVVSSATVQAAQAAHSAAASLASTQQIKPGASIPDIQIKENDPKQTFSLAGLPGKNIILGVPGAYTGSCSAQIPEYVKKYSEFQNKGIKGIYVVAVNDVFVMKAWKENIAPQGTEVHFIADDQGSLSTALGLLFDATPLLGGPRSKRAALIVEDGKVLDILVEAAPPDVILTKADNVLSKL
ncbi:hypothetical protein Clacol_004888 [Clathrus columnatus]|uniref:Thioredoxin domain-containing protein n=1 Tax=Clathrus columnatus TaxID=1419009 RepID=A0AAV5ACB5_9AGAM|nr:hypothetical protein Clacol_004888 [Clathrus columnatus]